ncbi:uncharacterized protein A4U43_C05F11590 [Asparagus officinalis]|uniref:Reticulon-like protein n=1 Tax=Asparagus officinalis TaxID=4686 RepID=A0A5P1ERJ1_ASPOF|nr:reticulon-like protein B9 [Asparagus officinalis]ONK68444.1 uncharacterized protein A4U43_C05F11590 [Asparagus officinalis]
MPKLIYDTNEPPSSSSRFHGRQRSLESLLGGGRVARILLWRNKQLSAGILAGVTLIWVLFEVVEYHFLTLLCHLFIITMLIIFIWSNAAPLFDREPPRIPDIILSESTFRDMALSFHARFNQFMSILHDIACGKDLKMFLLAILSLWIISVIGSCCSALNLLYFGFLCLHTLPALYEQYEGEVDHIASKGSQDLKKIYNKFDTKVLDKIPRASKDKSKKVK